MATKTTIEMAREAAGDDWGLFQEFMPEIHRLAELVRADERARMAEQPAQQQTMYLESGGAGYGPAPERKLIIGYVNKPEQPAKEENK